MRGSDPLIQTARGKLQSKRSKLNDQINKELRLRNGAENLFRATGNKKLKELVSLELSFFNSNIQLFKEELAELNSSVEIYQHDNCTASIPMIPLGLKETKEINLLLPIKDFILEQYSEDGSNYDKELNELMEIRQAIRTPLRNEAGVELLFEYYNQLYYLEKRFFPRDRSLGIYFHWYDSLTGVPNTQRTVGFEKGSVLFNIGALYTQIACKQDHSKVSEINDAITNFENAAGAFHYLQNNFSHAPSMDMQPETLNMLTQLMLSQAQECVFEKRTLHGQPEGIISNVDVAQEAAMVSGMYSEVHKLMNAGHSSVKTYVPYSWVSMVFVKHQYYQALSHYYVAMALLEQKDSGVESKLKQIFENLHSMADLENETNTLIPPKNTEERNLLGKAHLREAIILNEEALRIHNICKQLRRIDNFQDILKSAHDRALWKFSELEEEDDFTELVTVPLIIGKSSEPVIFIFPELQNYKVTDLFKKLGPLSIFNAKNQWSAPRTLPLQRNPEQGYGFSVRGDSPVIIADVDPGGIAERAGVKVGDFLVGINGVDTKWARHNDVVQLVRRAVDHMTVGLVTPLGKSYLDPQRSPSTSSMSTPTRMQSPSGSLASHPSTKGSTRGRLSAPWVFIRKQSSRETVEREHHTNSNVVLR